MITAAAAAITPCCCSFSSLLSLPLRSAAAAALLLVRLQFGVIGADRCLARNVNPRHWKLCRRHPTSLPSNAR